MEMFGLSEGAVRLGVFASIFVLMACAEAIVPRRDRVQSRGRRWFTNLSLVIVDSLVLRVIFPILAAGTAAYAQDKGWGLLNFAALPLWFEIIFAFIALDFAVWAQHVASHKIPVLWRIHKVHHADRDIDVTTGIRFHPFEIILSMAYKLLVVIALGPAALAVVLFEIILNASAMFNHANVKLPLGLDRVLRALIVTPDMHRVHHSVIPRETDSNYGFFFSVWDRLFGTYIAQPYHGHTGVVIGLDQYQDDGPSSLFWSILLPFKKSEILANPEAGTEAPQ
jgi:sterol desaturase/sphingolipid hydroxylase (fatty acid hydroxylase superfamily)